MRDIVERGYAGGYTAVTHFLRLKRLWALLHELRGQTLKRDQLLLKLGAGNKDEGRAWHLVEIGLPGSRGPVTAETFTFALRRD